jgi:hypothetical protein
MIIYKDEPIYAVKPYITFELSYIIHTLFCLLREKILLQVPIQLVRIEEAKLLEHLLFTSDRPCNGLMFSYFMDFAKHMQKIL